MILVILWKVSHTKARLLAGLDTRSSLVGLYINLLDIRLTLFPQLLSTT
jgi:hypothetical protein